MIKWFCGTFLDSPAGSAFFYITNLSDLVRIYIYKMIDVGLAKVLSKLNILIFPYPKKILFNLKITKYFHLNIKCVCILSYVLTLCDPMDGSLSGSSVHGIFQARTLEWAAISFSMDLPNPQTEPRSLAMQVDSLPSEPPGKPLNIKYQSIKL